MKPFSKAPVNFGSGDLVLFMSGGRRSIAPWNRVFLVLLLSRFSILSSSVQSPEASEPPIRATEEATVSRACRRSSCDFKIPALQLAYCPARCLFTLSLLLQELILTSGCSLAVSVPGSRMFGVDESVVGAGARARGEG